MGFVIGAIVIVLGTVSFGFITRKKYYKDIDRLEAWKIEVLNSPILEELTKVKQLNMTGQTEELFERWRAEWDEIAAGNLPGIEEQLFEAEELIDKLRFKKAKEVQSQIEINLIDTEGKIKMILGEVQDLVGSEQKNREEMEELKRIYRESKKTLLAHRHTFGKSVELLEKQLDDCIMKFQDFEEKTKNGDYLEAREIVLMIRESLTKVTRKIEVTPNLLVDCQTGLPMQISELKEGYHEMLGQGYSLDHLDFDNEMERIEGQIETMLAQIESTESEEVEKGIESAKVSIDHMYMRLEKEVLAKHYIQKNHHQSKGHLTDISRNNRILKTETEIVKLTYHMSEVELEKQKQTEQQLSKLFSQFEQLELKISQQDFAQTQLSEELREIMELLDELEQEQEDYREILNALRKDELAAREKVRDLNKKMGDTIRTVTKSKIPGLPKEYEYLLDDAEESIQNVINKLSEKPLDIPTVQHFLNLAVMAVEDLAGTTKEMLENVALAEKVIQYGNRYKSSYSVVAEGLNEAELAFRAYDYKTALEQAATAIEKVEPGAIKKIEGIVTDKNL